MHSEVLETRCTNIVFLSTNCVWSHYLQISHNLAIIFLVFRELANVLNNYCFHAENMLLDTKKFIFCMKTVIM